MKAGHEYLFFFHEDQDYRGTFSCIQYILFYTFLLCKLSWYKFVPFWYKYIIPPVRQINTSVFNKLATFSAITFVLGTCENYFSAIHWQNRSEGILNSPSMICKYIPFSLQFSKLVHLQKDWLLLRSNNSYGS